GASPLREWSGEVAASLSSLSVVLAGHRRAAIGVLTASPEVASYPAGSTPHASQRRSIPRATRRLAKSNCANMPWIGRLRPILKTLQILKLLAPRAGAYAVTLSFTLAKIAAS
ncbi:hypothetical protein, partial [Mesorhizobium sp. M4A.F.Ca.ET.050.02.1.1]|uniref:hypothetical protein n=1 Tax=Mesorhizobium sp. M4A.F.Ca.ET.050.02.1.1 TaxID=2496754 RepID=UPI001AEC8C37